MDHESHSSNGSWSVTHCLLLCIERLNLSHSDKVRG